jgi:hypothetical protein
MHEVIHQWSDGYGAALTFTYVTALPMRDAAAYVTFNGDDRADVFADANDLRSIAAAALAMAATLEARSTEGS